MQHEMKGTKENQVVKISNWILLRDHGGQKKWGNCFNSGKKKDCQPRMLSSLKLLIGYLSVC